MVGMAVELGFEEYLGVDRMGKGNTDHPRQGAKHEETKRCNIVGYTCGFDKHLMGKKVPRAWKHCKRV